MRIKEIVIKTGLSASTIRYYEKLGIIRNIAKDENAIRVYTENDLNWIRFLKGFKGTRIPLKELIRYSDLYYQGDSTIDDRIHLLNRHGEYLTQSIAKLTSSLEFVKRKIEFYNNKKKNLRPTDENLNCL